ncbi:unnamed protein product [Peniophora sp. CBMAI 1063]|nr:unnamed protein product [Peniophora sp. CBMAI 1063]
MGERTTGAVAATYGSLSSQDTKAIDIVMDNVQQRQQRHDVRIGTRDDMVTGSAGTGTVLEGLQPGDLSLTEILKSKAAAKDRRMALNADEVYDNFLDEGHDMAVKVTQFIDALVSFIPQLSDMSDDVEALQKKLGKHQIDPYRLTEVHPLGTNGANEVSTQGLNDASTDFAEQIGLTNEDKLRDRAVFWHGDGKTYNGWLTLKRNLAGLKNMLVSFRYAVPVLAPWHLKWTGLGRIINCFWGDREYGKTDPSTLAGMARALNIPPPSDWAHPHFYKYAHLVEVVATGHMLHCWETHFGCDNLESYFKNIVETRGKTALPSFAELVEIAKLLVKRFASTRAFEQAVGPHPMDDVISGDESVSESAPIGEKWNLPAIPCAEEKPREYEHKDADWVLGNSILLLRDALEFLETCTATARGDPERAWETYKACGEHHNYATYLIEMLCLIELELRARARMALMDNWLVNLKGQPGHFQERDLMQEHFNFWLEELSQHKGKQFDDHWFRRTISPHVHRFLRIKDQMEASVALKPRRKEHTEPPKTNEIREAMRLCRQADLHRRHDGRLCGSKAEDHFAKGYKKLAFEGKLEKYIEKSLAVWRSENVEREMPEGVRDLSVYLHEPIHHDPDTGRLVI